MRGRYDYVDNATPTTDAYESFVACFGPDGYHEIQTSGRTYSHGWPILWRINLEHTEDVLEARESFLRPEDSPAIPRQGREQRKACEGEQ